MTSRWVRGFVLVTFTTLLTVLFWIILRYWYQLSIRP